MLAGIDLAGRNVIVTGGYSGIGVETTRALAAAGAHVTVPARTPDKARAALAGLANVELDVLDLMDPGSIDAFARDWLARHDAAAYPHLQRRDHGCAARARQPRLREPVRHQSPRAFPAALPPVVRAGGSARRASRHALLARASHHADELRRPQLRAPRVPQVVRLRPGEDGQQPLRARRGRARPRARHPCICRAPGRDHDRPAAFTAARGTGRHGLDHGGRRREPALQDRSSKARPPRCGRLPARNSRAAAACIAKTATSPAPSRARTKVPPACGPGPSIPTRPRNSGRFQSN